MTCTHPVRMGNGYTVPCGHCMACRIKRTSEWATRIMDEAAYWKESCFMTLTFNDECLPLDGSLSKEVIQKYVKRVRKNTDKEGEVLSMR